MVAKGYAQAEGVNYNEMISLVIKHISICALLAIVELFDLELEQLDVKNPCVVIWRRISTCASCVSLRAM